MVKKEDYKFFLETFPIYELRNYARSIGVKNTTSKRKDELIDSILGIQYDEVKPVWTNRGRPAKSNMSSIDKVNSSNNMVDELINYKANLRKKLQNAVNKFMQEIDDILDKK